MNQQMLWGPSHLWPKNVFDSNYIMAGRAFVVAKEVLIMETVVQYFDEKLFWCKFSYVIKYLYSVINFNHVKLRYIEPCNFLVKHALLSQPSKRAMLSHFGLVLFMAYRLWNRSQMNTTGLTDHKPMLVQIMAWCRQATRHYLSECWPKFWRH